MGTTTQLSLPFPNGIDNLSTIDTTVQSLAEAVENEILLDRTDIATNTADIATNTADIADINDRFVLTGFTYYIDQASGSDSNDGLSVGTAFASFEHAYAQYNLAFNYAANVTFEFVGTYTGDVNIRSFTGSIMTIQGSSGPTINGRIQVPYCKGHVDIVGLTINATTAQAINVLRDSSWVKLSNCIISGASGQPTVQAQGQSTIYLTGCDIKGGDSSVRAFFGAIVSIENCTSTTPATTRALWAQTGAIISYSGTRPTGKVRMEGGGQIATGRTGGMGFHSALPFFVPPETIESFSVDLTTSGVVYNPLKHAIITRHYNTTVRQLYHTNANALNTLSFLHAAQTGTTQYYGSTHQVIPPNTPLMVSAAPYSVHGFRFDVPEGITAFLQPAVANTTTYTVPAGKKLLLTSVSSQSNFFINSILAGAYLLYYRTTNEGGTQWEPTLLPAGSTLGWSTAVGSATGWLIDD